MGHAVKINKSARKEIDGLEKQEKDRVLDAIEALSDHPRPKDCKKLKGSDLYRIRVGDYRIVYEIHDNALIILVVKIGHRREVYRG